MLFIKVIVDTLWEYAERLPELPGDATRSRSARETTWMHNISPWFFKRLWKKKQRVCVANYVVAFHLTDYHLTPHVSKKSQMTLWTSSAAQKVTPDCPRASAWRICLFWNRRIGRRVTVWRRRLVDNSCRTRGWNGETREALGEDAAHWVIKRSEMTERLVEFKHNYFSLQEVSDDAGRGSCHKVESVISADWVEVWWHSTQHETPRSQIRRHWEAKTAANAPKTVE